MDVQIFDEHSSVLPVWWAASRLAGGTEDAKTVVYLDAHLDLQWVNPERLSRLERCGSQEEIKALEKRHHMLPDGSSGYSLEDFLYPASRLGLIERVVWVMPPHVSRGYTDAVFAELQQMAGIEIDELDSFRRTDGGWIEGRLLGLDLTICELSQLGEMALPRGCILDVDADYFVTVPGDTLWTRPRAVWEVLHSLPIDPELSSVSRSISSGFTPVKYHGIADTLAALLEGREGDAKELDLLLDKGTQSGQDPIGMPSEVLRSLCAIRNRQLPVDRVRLVYLTSELEKRACEDEDSALAHVAMGLIYCAADRVDEAIGSYDTASEYLGPHPESAIEIARLLFAGSRVEEMRFYATAAMADDGTRTAAHFLIGIADCQSGALDRGVSHLESAHALAPAWREVLVALLQASTKRGDTGASRSYLEQIELIDRVQRSLAAELAPRA